MTLLIKNFAENCISGVWKLEESESELLELISLSDNDKNKLSSISSEKRRVEIIATRVLMQSIGLKEEIYYIEKIPFCNNGYICISHSKSLVTVIWHPNYKTAIDVEEIKDKILNVSDKVFSDSEIYFCRNDKKKLTILWNCKEAIYKIFGDKDLIFKTEITVCPFSFENNKILAIVKKNNIEKKYILNFIEIHKNTLCWCIDN